MKYFSELANHRYFNGASSAFLICVYLYFLYNHITAIQTGRISPSVVIFMLMETIIIFLFLIKRQPDAHTAEFIPWFFILVLNFVPLIFSPTGQITSTIVGDISLVIGGLLAIGSYLSLNSSSSITPTLCSIRKNGPYTFVRHPMYLSYCIIYIGYLLVAFSYLNLIILVTLLACLIIRIILEEKLLLQNCEYYEYSKKVTFRLVPFIF